MHKPIFIKNLSFAFENEKTCLNNFSTNIYPGDHIAVIGNNGSGKSTLLNIVRGKISPLSGEIVIPQDLRVGYIEQTICKYKELSGANRFNRRFTEVLTNYPELLLLDEPTNHLDKRNRKNLIRMLKKYSGTLIIVTHDIEVLRNCVDTIWHIEDGVINIFSGKYDDYIAKKRNMKIGIEQEIHKLGCEKKALKIQLAKEQQKISKSKKQGKKKVANKKWTKMVGDLKGMKAEKSQGKKIKSIESKKQKLYSKLADLRLPEEIVPKYHIIGQNLTGKNIVTIRDGCIGYKNKPEILSEINFSLLGNEHVAICGDNGTGKSTLIKAIAGDNNLFKKGNWIVPKQIDIGYIDQHYSNLSFEKSVIDNIYQVQPSWSMHEVRKHLNSFLFRKNEEVDLLVTNLSGGEKARLSLAVIAAKMPKLLLLDEVTNNIDLETKNHLIQILQNYPGAMIIISHEEEFLSQIGIQHYYEIKDETIKTIV